MQDGDHRQQQPVCRKGLPVHIFVSFLPVSGCQPFRKARGSGRGRGTRKTSPLWMSPAGQKTAQVTVTSRNRSNWQMQERKTESPLEAQGRASRTLLAGAAEFRWRGGDCTAGPCRLLKGQGSFLVPGTGLYVLHCPPEWVAPD